MPLKEVDLKTFEAYKKAIRLDLPKVSAGNAKFWIYRDVELPTAAGKKQKIASFIALVDDRAIKPILRGRKLVCTGRCGLEDGKVSFEAETGKVPYRLLKTSVPLFLGKLLHIPANVNPDADDEAEEVESEPAVETAQAPVASSVPPPPPPPGAQSRAEPPSPPPPGLAAVWNKLLKDVQAEVASHPERKDALTRAAAGIPDLIKADKADEAKQRMDALQALLNAPAQTGTSLAAMWNKLAKDLQTAVAGHPERRESLSQAASGIPDLIKANKVEEARQKMEALQKLLDAGTASAGSGAATAAELTARWNTQVKEMQAAAAAHPEKKPDIVRAGAGIPDMIRAGKLDLAKKLMDGVDTVLKALSQVEEPPTEPRPEGVVTPEQESAEESAEQSPEERSEPRPGPATAAELTARWNTLVKQMQAAAAAHPEKKPDIVRAGAGIPDMIRAGKLDLAKKLMDGVDTVLKALPQVEEPPTEPRPEGVVTPEQESAEESAEESPEERSEAAANQLEFERRFADLDEQATDVLESGPRNAAKIQTVLHFAREKGEQRLYDAALLALDNLERLLDAADDDEESDSGTPYEGLVKYRTALLGFTKAKGRVAGQIAALKSTIPTVLPDEAEIAGELATELSNWNDELGELVNDAMNTAEDDQSPVTDAIRNRLAEYIAELNSNELIRYADQNKFGVPVSIASTLGTALKNIQQAMPA